MNGTPPLDLAVLIGKQSLFTRLNNDEMKELVNLFKRQEISAGTTIVQEGELVDNVYLIAQGTVDVQTSTIQSGMESMRSVAILSAGEAIGLNETGFYSLSGKRTATVVAMTDVVLYRLSVAEFHGFMLAHSHVSKMVHDIADDL